MAKYREKSNVSPSPASPFGLADPGAQLTCGRQALSHRQGWCCNAPLAAGHRRPERCSAAVPQAAAALMVDHAIFDFETTPNAL